MFGRKVFALRLAPAVWAAVIIASCTMFCSLSTDGSLSMLYFIEAALMVLIGACWLKSDLLDLQKGHQEGKRFVWYTMRHRFGICLALVVTILLCCGGVFLKPIDPWKPDPVHVAFACCEIVFVALLLAGSTASVQAVYKGMAINQTTSVNAASVKIAAAQQTNQQS